MNQGSSRLKYPDANYDYVYELWNQLVEDSSTRLNYATKVLKTHEFLHNMCMEQPARERYCCIMQFIARLRRVKGTLSLDDIPETLSLSETFKVITPHLPPTVELTYYSVN